MCGPVEKKWLSKQRPAQAMEKYSVWNRGMDCTGMTDLT